MKRVEFIVPGPLLGYRQTTMKTIWHPKERARSKSYGQFKEKVLILSIQAGLPNMGKAEKEKPPRLSVEVFWKKEPRIDWANIYKSCEDSIWYQWDRHVIPGKYSGVIWDSGREEARIVVEI